MSVRADAETLRKIPLFRECESVPLQIMAFAAERQDFSTGEDLLSEGKKARAAFFVLNGSIDLRSANQSIGRAEAGSFLGEVAMIGGNPSSLTARARKAAGDSDSPARSRSPRSGSPNRQQ